MTLILLIRHGENDYVKKGLMAGRLPDVHLNAKGQEQAIGIANKLADAPIAAIYSSPLERALETAEPLAEILSQPVIVKPGLIEIDVGEWQGQKVKKLSRLKSWKIIQQNPSRMRFPGGESVFQAQFRICNELEEITSQYARDQTVACISHADPIKLAISYFIGLPLDCFQRLIIAPASISVLDISEDGSRLIGLNYQHSFSLRKL